MKKNQEGGYEYHASSKIGFLDLVDETVSVCQVTAKQIFFSQRTSTLSKELGSANLCSLLE